MAKLPKGFRKKLDILPHKEGYERRQEMVDEIDKKGTFLPKSVKYQDMDASFIDFVKNEINLTLDGKKVPVIFLTIQRWVEFTRAWEFTDEFKDISVPFITIVRKPDIQEGTNQQGLWNVAGLPTYTYIKVPTWDGNRKGVDVYKIPQPISVDITYEVRLFCNKMRDLNDINLIMQKTFRSRQHYINPNAHPMPLHLETIGDESNISDFENRKFYVQLFELLLKGYVLDSDDFEVVPAINRALVATEIDTDISLSPKLKVSLDANNKSVTFSVVARALAVANFSTELEFNIRFTKLNIISNIDSVTYTLDGNPVNLPFVGSAGQKLHIYINKDLTKTGKFQLLGNLI